MKIAIAGTGYFGLYNAVLVLLCRCLYMPWVLLGQRGPDMQASVGARRAEALNPFHDTHLFEPRCGKVPVLTKLG